VFPFFLQPDMVFKCNHDVFWKSGVCNIYFHPENAFWRTGRFSRSFYSINSQFI
jgi:hypothetical protein